MRRKEGRAITAREYGNMLKRALWSKQGFDLIEQMGCGWNDGGCWTLAQGLYNWFKDVLMYCVYADGEPQHIIVKLRERDIFIDGDGVSSEPELINRMVEDEFVTGVITIEPFSSQYCLATANDIQLWQDISDRVTDFLHAEFGDGEKFLWNLSEPP